MQSTNEKTEGVRGDFRAREGMAVIHHEDA
jgi:hypothetical protein